MRHLRNLLAFNYGFWIAAFFCLLSVGCVSPVKEGAPAEIERVNSPTMDVSDDIPDRMMMNVVNGGDADLEEMRAKTIEMKKIIDRLEKLNDSLERLTETISVE